MKLELLCDILDMSIIILALKWSNISLSVTDTFLEEKPLNLRKWAES